MTLYKLILEEEFPCYKLHSYKVTNIQSNKRKLSETDSTLILLDGFIYLNELGSNRKEIIIDIEFSKNYIRDNLIISYQVLYNSVISEIRILKLKELL